jgi:hypothetical protein
MRYLVGFVCVLAGSLASPLSVGAQGDPGTEQDPARRASSTSFFEFTRPEEAASERRLVYAGGALVVRGPALMIATRSRLGIRKGKLRRSEEGDRGSNLEWLEWSDLQWLQWLLQVQQRVDPEPATWSPPLSEGSWLRLEVGFAGMRVVPRPPPEVPEYSRRRGKRIGIAVGVTAGVLVGLAIGSAVAVSNWEL